jgi:hypothetical protein
MQKIVSTPKIPIRQVALNSLTLHDPVQQCVSENIAPNFFSFIYRYEHE